MTGAMLAASLGSVLALTAHGAGASDVQIIGLTGQHLTLTEADLAKRPHTTVTTTVEGKVIRFDGVPLSDLLQLVGAPQGKDLRGRGLCDVVLVSAADGYKVVLALAETDPLFRRDAVILADQADGAPLKEMSGPFRLVVEGDQRGARLARMVTEIRVLQLPDCAAK